jgi:Flp pilus assembly pilin Flp
MKRTVKLRTSEGHKVRIVLEDWGSGLDHSMRRWTSEDGLWQCLDDPHETAVASTRGQTMVEYALIIAAVGVVAWGAYNLTGHDIGSMASGIDSSLTNA